MTPILYIVATLQALSGRLADATRDDRGEINSNVAWAGLMLVVAVAIVLTKATGAANSFDFGF
jgi:hypothetical protein